MRSRARAKQFARVARPIRERPFAGTRVGHDVVDGALQRADHQRSFELEAHGDVIGWITRLNLLQVPEALLAYGRGKDVHVPGERVADAIALM